MKTSKGQMNSVMPGERLGVGPRAPQAGIQFSCSENQKLDSRLHGNDKSRTHTGIFTLALLLGLATGQAAAAPSVSVNNASVMEGDSGTTPLNFTLSRTGDTRRPVAVTVETNDGSVNPATAGSDYTAIPAGTKVVIPAGETAVMVPVSIIGDTDSEPDETFFLHLTGAREIAAPSFTKTDYVAGRDPWDVKIGDLNGDGKPDLVVANDVSGDLSVLLNNGNGTFANAVHYSTGARSCPDSVVIGDLNADGKPDLAAADCAGNVVTLSGNGDGTFATAVAYPTGDRSNLIVLRQRELNGDDDPDLVVLDNGNNKVLALLNNGSGGFGAATTLLSLASSPGGFDMSDFNGDGRLDLAVSFTGNAGKLSVFLASASGGFEAPADYPTGSGSSHVAAGDLNGDGKPDLAVSNSSTVSVLLNNGDGTFADAVNHPAGDDTQGLSIGDINGDGRPDIAVANQNGGNVSVLINNGNGAFASAVNFATSGGALAVAIGDLDGNGAADLAVANRDGFNVSVLLAPAPVAVTVTTSEGLGTILDDDAPPAPPPSVVSITRDGASPTAASTVSWTVTFSRAVTGVDATDFQTVGSVREESQGRNDDNINVDAVVVSGSGDTYVVSVNTGGGKNARGEVSLLLQDDDSIKAVDDGQPLGGVGVNGNASGEAYEINRDAAPDAIAFTDVTGVARGSTQTGMTTVTGINIAVPVTVENGSYSVGCTGSFTSEAGTVSNGQTVCVRHSASSQFSRTVTSNLTVSNEAVGFPVSGSFSSTTEAQDSVPEAFTFNARSNVEPGSTQESNVVAVSGINDAAAISVSGGEYRLYTSGVPGSYRSTAGTISPGQQVQLRHTASLMFATATDTDLTIGGVPGRFTSTTLAREPGQGTIHPDGRSGTVPDSNEEMVSLGVSGGTLVALRRIPQPDGVPGGFTYPNGFFEFEITGLSPGATVTVTLTLPEGSNPDAYIKCDSTGCAPFAGASFNGNVVTLTLTDGGAGDDDGLANGSISDPGAPALRTVNPPAAAPGGSEGGSASWHLLMGLMLLGLLRARRSQPRLERAARI